MGSLKHGDLVLKRSNWYARTVAYSPFYKNASEPLPNNGSFTEEVLCEKCEKFVFLTFHQDVFNKSFDCY